MFDKQQSSIGVTLNYNITSAKLNEYTFFGTNFNEDNKEDKYESNIGINFNNDNIDLELDNFKLHNSDSIMKVRHNKVKPRIDLFKNYNIKGVIEESILDNQKINSQDWQRKLILEGGFFGLNFCKKWMDSKISIYDYDNTVSSFESDISFGIHNKDKKIASRLSYDTNNNSSFYFKSFFETFGDIGFGFKIESDTDNETFYFWNSNPKTYSTAFTSDDTTQEIYFKGNIVPSEHAFLWKYKTNDDDDILSLGYEYNSKESFLKNFQINLDINCEDTDEFIKSADIVSNVDIKNYNLLTDYSFENNGDDVLLQTILKK
ncbi:hypothetical protein CPAV1605_288 [seawater metagenome]|uniref:Uncharacterized protein n=1 Tax=seawater metagenome TaxID=1561972 RepID=A0A5E8CGL6_9ZZZZ